MEEKKFPFKTAIWAVVILAVLFIFKPEVQGLLRNSTELDILGVKLKVSDKDSEALLKAQADFETQVAAFTAKIDHQDTTIGSLNALIDNLQGEIAGCGEAEATAGEINNTLRNLSSENATIRQQPLLKRDYKLIQKKVN